MSEKNPTILAIETSCDETGIAILRMAKPKIQNPKSKPNELSLVADFSSKKMIVLAHAVASQIDIHTETGGVVPDVAAREHTKVIRPLIEKVMREAGVDFDGIDAIAVTVGPGLMPALVVGVQTARTLAVALQKPIIPVHHIEGHIASALLSVGQAQNPKHKNQNEFQIPNNKEIFPALALIVSGGHTMLVAVVGWLHYRLLGQTRDDAAGEAFDKVARLLDLPYPGGPNLSKLAESGDVTAFDFPRPMLDSGDFDFSFSGLKTAVLYTLRDNPNANKADIAASFEAAVVDSLIVKTKRALEAGPYKTLLLAGGVAANTKLREQVKLLANEQGINLGIAPPWLCGDNAVMIGQVGLLAYSEGRQIGWQQVDAKARIPLEQFSFSTPEATDVGGYTSGK